jgi:hypothetical protein
VGAGGNVAVGTSVAGIGGGATVTCTGTSTVTTITSAVGGTAVGSTTGISVGEVRAPQAERTTTRMRDKVISLSIKISFYQKEF